MAVSIPGMAERIGPKRSVRAYLAEWREAKHLTQQQVADRIGTTHVTISRWETGMRSPDDNAKAAYAEALGIEFQDLYRHPDQPSADELLRDQPAEIIDQALRVIRAMRRTS